MDGKVVEFTAPVLVKELLMNFEGFGVKSSRKSSKHLPPSFELKLGGIYYLLPSEAPMQLKSMVTAVPVKAEPEPNTPFKRVKVVITKKQLQDLLEKKISVEKIILGTDKTCSVDCPANWKPTLTSIPEENEFNTI
ncbi:hypothetical protein Salat_0888900 [Sesamum alatum]|uniref:Uncharacterized protein n=1 Tax=Sesamum alatum TaxID=300844 RepID=A0AAE2CQZ5_9LAMI|nr:hypothetical protein Salat_0888900 [Sesamum alatum]